MTTTGPSRKNQVSGGSPASFGALLPAGAWLRNPALRSWPLLLFVLLVAVPPVGLVIIGPTPTMSTFDDAAWLYAAYFAFAWLLLIGVIVRPAAVTRQLLVLVVVISLVTQVPIALAIEKANPTNFNSLASTILTTGLPEELAKAIPVLVIALMLRNRLSPVDYLFLGAVSGLVFGASEVVHYITNGAGISQAGAGIVILNYVWRFLTDPITHACWAGLTGYFIGLAVSGRYRWYRVGWIGLLMAMVLHGLNDWTPVNGHWTWVLLVAVSGILFVGYAKGGPHQAAFGVGPAPSPGATAPAATAPAATAPAATAPAATAPAPAPAGAWYGARQAAASAPTASAPTASAPTAASASHAGASAQPAAPAGSSATRPVGAASGRGGWWQGLAAPPASGAGPVVSAPPPAQRSKPWWEE
jgi:RsiW-degrading membrane proteinase PrsW (M82 family)